MPTELLSLLLHQWLNCRLRIVARRWKDVRDSVYSHGHHSANHSKAVIQRNLTTYSINLYDNNAKLGRWGYLCYHPFVFLRYKVKPTAGNNSGSFSDCEFCKLSQTLSLLVLLDTDVVKPMKEKKTTTSFKNTNSNLHSLPNKKHRYLARIACTNISIASTQFYTGFFRIDTLDIPHRGSWLPCQSGQHYWLCCDETKWLLWADQLCPLKQHKITVNTVSLLPNYGWKPEAETTSH